MGAASRARSGAAGAGARAGRDKLGKGHPVPGDEATTADPYWNKDEAAHAGEMRVNNGGDPGRDDYGLPPVDIKVPDDARELDRDVQAYRRELRSLHRRMLARRLTGPLSRDGMVLPLLAGCLALTLLAATLLTVFTVGQGAIGQGQGPVGGPITHPGSARSGAASSAAGSSGASLGPAIGRPGGPLPGTMVLVDGQPMHLSDITGPGEFVVVLALIPPACKCLRDLRQLTVQAQVGGAQTYLVGVRGENVSQLSNQVGLGAAHTVVDTGGQLPALYRNSTVLTAVVVDKDGSVAHLVTDKHGFQIIKAQVHALVSGHTGQSPAPGVTQPSSAGPKQVTAAPATPAG
jgi:hypothetical protein